MSLANQLQHTMVDTHVRLYQLTKGALGARLFGVPTLLLTTTGAKSGLSRTTPLGYGRRGEDYLVVASNNGSDRAPSWLHNLLANPSVTIQVGDRTLPARATVVRRGQPGYDVLFGKANEAVGGRYYAYQERTDRPIPVVVLTPTA